MPRLAWNLVVMKTKHDKNSEAARALRLAESKAKTCGKVSAADQKQAHAARVKFKNAKKAWKLARKKAKRSTKLAKLAKKNLATLEKHLKRLKRKTGKPIAKPTTKFSGTIKPIRQHKRPVTSLPSTLAGVAANPSNPSVANPSSGQS